MVDDQLGVAPDVKPLDTQLDGDAQAIDECLILSHIIGGGKMDANYVPHAFLEGQNEDQPHAGAFLHQRSIEVHRPVLLVNDCWWHLDLGPFCDEISQHLGLDGRSGGICNALTHQLECPFRGSTHGILVLDDLAKGERCHTVTGCDSK